MTDAGNDINYTLILAGLKEIKRMCESRAKCTGCPLYDSDIDECFKGAQPRVWKLEDKVVTHIQHHLFKDDDAL